MIKTPCEIILWDFLPALRRELVKAMVKNGLKRKEIARIFGLTESAISQYMKLKRGKNFRFTKKMKKEIEKAAIRIAKSKKRETVVPEICRLCSILRRQKSFVNFIKQENPYLARYDFVRIICPKEE